MFSGVLSPAYRGYFRGFSLSKPINAHNFSTMQPTPSIVASKDSQLITEDMSIEHNNDIVGRVFAMV